MSLEEIQLLHEKLEGLEEHLSVLESKEDQLLQAIEQVQRKLNTPSVVTPRFSKRVTIIAGSALAVWTIGLGVIVVAMLAQ